MQKAWHYEEYGPKEVLKLGDFPLPTPQHNQLHVQVRAAALNPIDSNRRQLRLFPSDLPTDPTGPYKFKDVIEALRYLGTRRARGKVVISAFPSPNLFGAISFESKKNPSPEVVSQTQQMSVH